MGSLGNGEFKNEHKKASNYYINWSVQMKARLGFKLTLALLTLLLFSGTLSAGGKNETAVTIWLVFFNSPGDCATSPCSEDDIFNNADAAADVCYLTGQSVQANGRATLAARLSEGTTHGCFFGLGLVDSDAAEVHSVHQEHGWSLMSGYGLENQVSQFEGDCNPNCADTQFTIHQPGDANAGESVSPVQRFADGSFIEGANSTLRREVDGIAFIVHTRFEEDE